MKRLLESNLKTWARSHEHLPLILRGARQVGKTYLIESFAQENFKHFVAINFELQPEFKGCFESLDPEIILREISLLTQQPITLDETLIFFDEIQTCPRALQSLRYFKEKLPRLHVIAAGSLLDFVLNDSNFSMPVGRVTFRYLYPMSFTEFLLANKDGMFVDYLSNANLDNPISPTLHATLLEKLKIYFFLGGMPAVVARFTEQPNDWVTIAEYQSALLKTYRADFSKYATLNQRKYLERLFERAPLILGQQFKYSRVDPDLLARDLKIALHLLIDAALITPAYACHASGIPLTAGKIEKKFKIFFLDIGLAQNAAHITPSFTSRMDLIQINQGALIEQLVAQEMLAYSASFDPIQLFFWDREKPGSSAEVDFVIQLDNRIIPIEVKAGKTGRLKSLRVFMQEKSCPMGIRIAALPLSFEDNILTIPLYLIKELPRLVKSYIP